MKAGTRKHYMTLMRPATVTDDHGGAKGLDDVIAKDVPCSLETLGGREAELARQNFATASAKVGCIGPLPVKTLDYWLLGDRRLEIVDIQDIEQNGVNLQMLVGEIVNG